MIEWFNDIRQALIEVADSDDSELVIDRRVSFKNKTVKYAKQLGEINDDPSRTSEKGLYSIRLQMDTGRANSDCDCGKQWQWVPFLPMKVGQALYWSEHGYCQRPQFESGVTKIQRGEIFDTKQWQVSWYCFCNCTPSHNCNLNWIYCNINCYLDLVFNLIA